MGNQVPDLRGLFLRGLGGNSAALATIQTDAGRDAKFTAGSIDDVRPSGNCVSKVYSYGFNGSGGSSTEYGYTVELSKAYGAAHTAEEFRPVNTAVRYLVRARP